MPSSVKQRVQAKTGLLVYEATLRVTRTARLPIESGRSSLTRQRCMISQSSCLPRRTKPGSLGVLLRSLEQPVGQNNAVEEMRVPVQEKRGGVHPAP
jgi:hypothetical protein